MVFTGRRTIEELQVKIEGDSGDLESSLAEVRAGLQLVESGLKDVEDEAEEAGDELTGLSARASGAAGALTGLGASAGGASAGVNSLRSSLFKLKLTAGTLAITTLPALSSAFVTVGAAAAGVGLGAGGVLGLGAAARGAEQLKEDLAIVRENIIETAAVVGERFGFGELVGRGIRAIDDIFAETLARVGPMLPEFAAALEDFGSTAANAIPVVTAELIQLGSDALPAIRDLLTFIAEEGPGAFQAMRESFTEIAPELRRFIGALVRLAPEFLEFSTTVTDTVLPIFTTLIGAVTEALQVFNSLPRPLKRAGAVAVALSPLIGMAGLAGAFATLAKKAALAAGSVAGATTAISAASIAGLGIASSEITPGQVGTTPVPGGAGLETTTDESTSALELLVGADLGQQRGEVLPGIPEEERPESTVPQPTEQQAMLFSGAAQPTGLPDRMSDLLEAIRAAMDETASATTETAATTSETALQTGATARTLQQSPLVGARNRCNLRDHLLEPFEQVRAGARPPGGRGATQQSILAGMAPRSQAAGPTSSGPRFLDAAFDPRKVEEAVRRGIEKADSDQTIVMDGKEVARTVRENESRHFGGGSTPR